MKSCFFLTSMLCLNQIVATENNTVFHADPATGCTAPHSGEILASPHECTDSQNTSFRENKIRSFLAENEHNLSPQQLNLFLLIIAHSKEQPLQIWKDLSRIPNEKLTDLFQQQLARLIVEVIGQKFDISRCVSAFLTISEEQYELFVNLTEALCKVHNNSTDREIIMQCLLDKNLSLISQVFIDAYRFLARPQLGIIHCKYLLEALLAVPEDQFTNSFIRCCADLTRFPMDYIVRVNIVKKLAELNHEAQHAIQDHLLAVRRQNQFFDCRYPHEIIQIILTLSPEINTCCAHFLNARQDFFDFVGLNNYRWFLPTQNRVYNLTQNLETLYRGYIPGGMGINIAHQARRGGIAFEIHDAAKQIIRVDGQEKPIIKAVLDQIKSFIGAKPMLPYDEAIKQIETVLSSLQQEYRAAANNTVGSPTALGALAEAPFEAALKEVCLPHWLRHTTCKIIMDS
ncbi:MAG: hypothetical protein Q8K36_00815, partial [Alphaproteobacteria bacterium]|nr:hypothetical protein [Alphaproteobacteria bacterium]